MRIDLSSIDREQFIVRDCVIAGDECALIIPNHLGTEWTKETLHLRSVIVRASDGLIVSASVKKFLNLGEKPHLYPDPTSFGDWRVTTKEDGSLVCVSQYKDSLIVRTRGTTDVRVHVTGPEILNLVVRHDVGRHPLLARGHSFVFEHNTPNCPIVIRHEKPELVLLKIVQHEGYQYLPPGVTDQVAAELGVRRPEVHSFASLQDIVETCKTLKGMEGFVLEYNGGANMVKIKGLEYLKLHAFRSTVSMGNLLDLFFLYERPTAEAFLDRLEREFDWESAQMAKEIVTQICQAHERAEDWVHAIQEVVWYGIFEGDKAQEILLGTWKPTRRDYALAIQSRFKEGLDRSVAFGVLDKKPVDDKMLRKLIEHELDRGGEPAIVTP